MHFSVSSLACLLLAASASSFSAAEASCPFAGGGVTYWYAAGATIVVPVNGQQRYWRCYDDHRFYDLGPVVYAEASTTALGNVCYSYNQPYYANHVNLIPSECWWAIPPAWLQAAYAATYPFGGG